MAAVQTRDEAVATADAAIETALATMIAANNSHDRVSALRLLVKRLLRKNVTNRTRPRAANE
jgi:hypothetical protein